MLSGVRQVFFDDADLSRVRVPPVQRGGRGDPSRDRDYQAGVAAPPIWTGSVGPKSLAATGRAADGWFPPMGSDWRSKLYRESRPRIDEAAATAGRDPAMIADIYNFGGRITPEPLATTRGDDGRWIGGSVRQWVEQLTTAVLEYGASGFIYRSTDHTPAAEALAAWARDIVPAVRDAIGT